MSIKIIICDDEKQQTDYLTALVLRWSEENEKPVAITTFKSAEAFLFAWSEDKNCDILLLDIQMNGLSGIELAKVIRKTDEMLPIIFITGYVDYMVDGYDVSAMHYLLKPVNEAKLFEVLEKAYMRLGKKDRSFIVKTNDESVKILQRDILYIEAFGHMILIKTTSGAHEIRQNISNTEQQLDSSMFIRCHRSYIISLKYISCITKTEVLLDSGERIPLSRRLYNEVNQAFIRYFKGVTE